MERDASWLSVAGNHFIRQVRHRAITRKSESLCWLSKSGGGGGMEHGAWGTGVVMNFLCILETVTLNYI